MKETCLKEFRAQPNDSAFAPHQERRQGQKHEAMRVIENTVLSALQFKQSVGKSFLGPNSNFVQSQLGTTSWLPCSSLEYKHADDEVCHLDDDPEERHPMNQIIMYNSGILNDLFDLVSQDFEITERPCSTVQAETHLALALVEVFTGNKDTCMKVLPQQHIAKIMSLLSTDPECRNSWDLLNTIVKVEELDLPLKRNQECIMTYLMQHRADIAQCLDQNPGVQFRLLRSGTRTPESDFNGRSGRPSGHLRRRREQVHRIEKSSIYRVGEVLNVLTGPRHLGSHTSGPMLDSCCGGGAGDLPHDVAMWKLLGMWRQEFKQAASLANENPRLLLLALKSTSAVRSVLPGISKRRLDRQKQSTQNIHGTLKYLFEGRAAHRIGDIGDPHPAGSPDEGREGHRYCPGCVSSSIRWGCGEVFMPRLV
uniref:Protein kinase domain-containing protein n=1 Tax=Macrostomum lignano TaxID=282301 RepID=A0A1I8FFX2_9PLAT